MNLFIFTQKTKDTETNHEKIKPSGAPSYLNQVKTFQKNNTRNICDQILRQPKKP